MSALSAVVVNPHSTCPRNVLREYVLCTDGTGHGNDFELTPTAKIQTKNLVEDYFGSEFPAICNHCGDIPA